MATQEVNSAFAANGHRIGDTSYQHVEVDVAAAAGTIVIQAPAKGKLVRAVLTAGSAIDATNNYITILMANKSNSDAAMLGSNDTGDGTDTAAYAKRVLVLGATAAVLLVSEGDWLALTTTVQGTVGAATKILLIFEILE